MHAESGNTISRKRASPIFRSCTEFGWLERLQEAKKLLAENDNNPVYGSFCHFILPYSSSVRQEPKSESTQTRRFVSDVLAPIVGRKPRTLQKDRLFGRGPFPFYRIAGSIRYDLDECIAIVEAGRVGAATR
jgi:hypothetical protein